MKNLPPQNLVERAIATLSPSWAMKRHAARSMMAMTGGYSGAGYKESLAYWQPGVGDSNADSVRDLRELRARSRDLVRNSPIACGAIDSQVTHVVGTGLSLQSRVNASVLGLDDDVATEWQKVTEQRFMLWAESELADAMGQQNFYELQDLAFRSRLESGDSFVLLTQVNRASWPFMLALQVIEADRISNPDGRSDTEQIVAGIEKDSAGAPVAVHICNRHPGQYTVQNDRKWTRVLIRGTSGRRNVVHLMRKTRPGQTRGIPELAPIIETLKQLTRYSQAEVDAAVNSAALALFAKMDPETFGELFDDDAQKGYIDSAKRWDGTVRSGAVVNLLPGESIESPVQNRPNPNYDAFVSSVMRQIGIGLNIPYEVLTKHFQSSYSAARAALLDAWRTFKIRREWLASKLCQPVYEEWLADEVANGNISAPGFFNDALTRAAWCGAKWSGDGPGAIDPMKEAEAAGKRMEIGLTTLSEEIVAYDGGDWQTKHRQQVEEHEARMEDGLLAEIGAPNPAQPVVPKQRQIPEQDGADDESEDGSEDAVQMKSGYQHHTHVHLPQGLDLSIPTPVVNVQFPHELSIPAPIVNVQPPEIRVEVAAPVVNVAAPEVHVAAPDVNVEAILPEQKAPVVLNQPTARTLPTGYELVRDSSGKIQGIIPKD